MALAAVACLPVAAQAGGPLFYTTAHEPVRWNNTAPVGYHTDLGPLGRFSNADAGLMVGVAISMWHTVPMADVVCQRTGAAALDIDATNFGPFLGPYGDVFEPVGYSTIVFDADGSIFELLFGRGSGVLGFAGPTFVEAGGDITPLSDTIAPGARYVEGVAFLNGQLVDGVYDPFSGNFEVSQASFDALVVHESGHFLGLAHTQIHGMRLDWRLNNTMPTTPVETMFPILLDTGQRTPGRDDAVALATLYPSADFATSTGVLSGRVLSGDGTSLTGINVVARNLGDPSDAVSTLSGEALGAGGEFRLRGLTPGAQYTVEMHGVNPWFSGGSRVGPFLVPAILPGPPEYFDAAESADPAADPPERFTPIVTAAGTHVGGIDLVVNRQRFEVRNETVVVPRESQYADLVVGDFDRDGRQDFVAAQIGWGPGTNQTMLYRGRGDGTFDNPVGVDDFPGNSVVVSGQFNPAIDANLDVAVASLGRNDVHVLCWDGRDGFTAPVTVLDLPVPSIFEVMIEDLARGDFDADGDDDLAVLYYEYYKSTMFILLSDGAGGFSIQTLDLGSSPYRYTARMLVGDFVHGSGDDLVLATFEPAPGLRLLVNDGTGQFASRFVSVGSMGAVQAAGDLNADGNLDVVLVNTQGVRSTFDLVLGDGAGGFTRSHRQLMPEPFHAGVATADFDGDGRLDIASTGGGYVSGEQLGTRVFVAFGDGAGGVREAITIFGLSHYPDAGFAAADFDGDRRPDLIVAKGGDFALESNPPSVLLNRFDFPTPVAFESFAATIEPDAVRLTWRSAAVGDPGIVLVQRADDAAGPWSDLSRVDAALASFEDRDVTTGHIYWYRLVSSGSRGESAIWAGPIRVAAGGGAQPALQLDVARKSDGRIEVRYALGQAAPLKLSVHDVRGRAVRILDRGARQPGVYARTWDRLDTAGVPVSRGVYFVHLRAGALDRSRKVVLDGR